MTKPSRTAATCCIEIGYRRFLMPIEAGLKVVALMQQGVECERDYHGGDQFLYVAGKTPEVQLTTVTPDQVSWSEAVPVKPPRQRGVAAAVAALEHQAPLQLPPPRRRP